MNYKIARIGLRSIGHPAARFDPLSLDLRSETGNEAVDSVIWLQNTGGKTVLLRLLFSVLAPSSADKIGPPVLDANGRGKANLPAYLGAGDTGHVVIEWRPTAGDTISADEVLLTGMVAEYRGHRMTGRLSDVVRHWYLVASDGSFDITHLPFADASGRPYSAHGFTSRLEDIAKRAAASARRSPLSVQITDRQGKWQQLLEDRGLDPVLFDYQAEMNRTEGSAGNIFGTWRNDAGFVRFLLEMLTPADTLESLTVEVREVLDKLRSQPALRLEHDFVAGAVAPLEKVATAETDRRAAEDRGVRLRGETRIARARFEAAAAADHREIERLTGEIDEANRLRAIADGSRRRLEDEARAYRHLAASFRHALCVTTLDAATKDDAAADLDARAWPLVPTIRRVRDLDARIRAAAEAVNKADLAAAPLREERNAAARAYRRHLEAHRVVATAGAAAEEQAVVVLRDAAKALEKAARDAAVTASGAADKADALRERVRTVASTRATALERGYVDRADEPSVAAVERHQAVIDGAGARVGRIGVRLDEIKERTDAIGIEERGHQDRRAQAKASASELAPRLEAARAERSRLVTSPRVIALVDVEPDLETAGAPIVDQLRAAAAASDRARIALESRTADDRRAADALAATGLLPGAADLERAVTALRDAGIAGARLGLHYLEEAVATDLHARAIERAPELAGGIVLTDPSRLAEARKVLAAVSLDSLLVIGVGRAADLVAAAEAGEPGAGDGAFVVAPLAGTHDRASAAVDRPLIARRLDEARDAAAELEKRAGVDRGVALEIEAHLRDWGSGELAAQEAVLAGHDTAVKDAGAALAVLDGERSELGAEDKGLRTEAERLAGDRNRAERAVGALGSLVTEEAATADAAGRIAALALEAEDWRGIEKSSNDEAEAKRVAADEALARATQLRSTASDLGGRAGAIEVEAGEPPDQAEAAGLVGADTDELSARFASLHALLEKRTTGSEEQARLTALGLTREATAADVEATEPDLRERATVLAADLAAETRAGIRLATEQATGRRRRAALALTRRRPRRTRCAPRSRRSRPKDGGPKSRPTRCRATSSLPRRRRPTSRPS